MRIAICDDMAQDRKLLSGVLRKFELEKNNEFTIFEYSTPEDLYSDYQKGNSFDIIFFDVYIGEILGTVAAKHMRELGYQKSIIFVTSSMDHALDGFRVHADGYLVKPYTYQDFKDSLARLEDRFKSEEKRIQFTSERIEYSIPLSEVILIESVNKGCNVYSEKETLFTWKKLKEFTEEIQSDSFYPVGRFSLVNLDMIQSMQEEYILLKNGTKVFPPKRDIMKIKQDINDYMWKCMRK